MKKYLTNKYILAFCLFICLGCNNQTPPSKITLYMQEDEQSVFTKITRQPDAVILKGEVTEYHWKGVGSDIPIFQATGARQLHFKDGKLVSYKYLWDNVTVRPLK